MESINALSRVAQAQQQQECFVPTSQVKETVYTAPSKGNCSLTTTSLNSTLESTQQSMVSLYSRHDYSHKNTAKKQEQLFDKNLFLEEVRKYRRLWDVLWPSYKERNTKAYAREKIAATFGKDGKINWLLNNCFKAQHFYIWGKDAKSVSEKDLKCLVALHKV